MVDELRGDDNTGDELRTATGVDHSGHNRDTARRSATDEFTVNGRLGTDTQTLSSSVENDAGRRAIHHPDRSKRVKPTAVGNDVSCEQS